MVEPDIITVVLHIILHGLTPAGAGYILRVVAPMRHQPFLKICASLLLIVGLGLLLAAGAVTRDRSSDPAACDSEDGTLTDPGGRVTGFCALPAVLVAGLPLTTLEAFHEGPLPEGVPAWTAVMRLQASRAPPVVA